MAVDLHVHSTHSDGTLTPTEIVQTAARVGLRAVGLTDHDAISGIPEFVAAGEAWTTLDAVPGVELSAAYGRAEVHILGYCLDWDHERLATRLAELGRARLERAGEMVARLRRLGVQLELADVLQIAAEGSIGRPQVARALVRLGTCRSMEEAFARFLKRGRPAYVPQERLRAEEAVDLVRDAGGISILAHPGLLSHGIAVGEVLRLGFDGLEAYHTAHSAAATERYLDLARRRGLLVTGGSDSHGPEATKPVAIGSVAVPDAVWAELKERAAASHRVPCRGSADVV
jgi:predicted metal-dependent phosphoesterase TrpH